MQPQGTRSAFTEFQLSRFSGWTLTILLCLVPVILWFTLNPITKFFSGGFSGFMTNLGQLTGLIGMVMYALNLIYSTRLRFLETLFGGLNKVFVAHHILGGLALIFLCFHPLFLAISYISVSMRRAALLLVPNGLAPIDALFSSANDLHFSVLQQWAVFFGIIAFWGMVVLLIITFFVKLPYVVWLFTHKFLGVAFFFAGLHVLFISSDTSVSPGLKYYLLGISALGLCAFVYRSLSGKIFIRKYKYKISKISTVGGNVSQVSMEPTGKKMEFKAGQFVFIRFLNGVVTSEWHPFSISSSPSDELLQISVKALGDYTSTLIKLKPRVVAEIEGAFGKFSYSNFKNKNQIWVAGGIGITPFLSMARSLPGDDYSIDLYYAVKTRSELIGQDELAKVYGAMNGKFRLIPFIADQQKGYLDVEFIKKRSRSIEGKEILVCGPPSMMKSLRGQFKSAGVSSRMIHTEEFGLQ